MIRQALGSLVLLLVVSGAAAAHAVVKHADPSSGTTLTAPPERISVEYTEPLDPTATAFTILDAKGASLASDFTLSEDGLKAEITPRAPLPSGGYLVKWETISQTDGHKTTGSWSFVVGSGALLPEEETTSRNFRVDAVAGKLLLYAGLGLTLAAPLFVITIHKEYDASQARLRRLALVGSGLVVAGTALFFAGQLGATGQAPGAYVGTEFGRALLVRAILALLLAILALLWWRRLVHPLVPFAASLVLIALASRYSHTAAFLSPLSLALVAHTLHYAALLVWGGGVALLYLHVRHLPRDGSPNDAYAAARAFGVLASVSVALAVLTGAIMFIALQGLTLGAWLDHDYGISLVSHTLLGFAMIGLGGLNRWIYVPRLDREARADALGAFRVSVKHETIIAVLVLLLAAAATNLQPPSGETDAPEQAAPRPTPMLFLPATGETYAMHLTIDPGPTLNAASNLSVHVFEPSTNATVADAYAVGITLRHIASNTTSDFIELANIGNGRYATEGTHFILTGEHEVTITVQTPRRFLDEAKLIVSPQ